MLLYAFHSYHHDIVCVMQHTFYTAGSMASASAELSASFSTSNILRLPYHRPFDVRTKQSHIHALERGSDEAHSSSGLLLNHFVAENSGKAYNPIALWKPEEIFYEDFLEDTPDFGIVDEGHIQYPVLVMNHQLFICWMDYLIVMWQLQALNNEFASLSSASANLKTRRRSVR
jgi:hypothetical protein